MFGYGCNYYNGNGTNISNYIKVGSIKNPSIKLQFGDNGVGVSAKYKWKNQMLISHSDTSYMINPRHLQQANVSFFDGHVKSVFPGELTLTDNWRF